MATLSKLERAIRERANDLDGPQRELALSQFSTYQRNAERIADLEGRARAVDSKPAASLEEVRVRQAQRATLAVELNQLMTANSRIAADISDMLKEGR